MAPSGPLDSLAGQTLQQLRQLARSLRIVGYSSLSRSALTEAVRLMLRRGRGQASTTAPTANVMAGISDGQGGQIPSTVPAETATTDSPTQVTFLPRDPQWAYVFWCISESDRLRASEANGAELCLRLADVTGLPLGVAHPHTLQEVVVDGRATEWFLPVPLCDRDYRVEIGYRLPAGGWLSLAFSSVARMPADAPSSVVADLYVPFSLEGLVPTQPQGTPSGSVDHERFYQLATPVYRGRFNGGSELLQEADRHGSDRLNDSGAGRWASGLRESGAGLNRQRSFWLVADAELIVYGATDPAASLYIGDEQISLAADGTFHVHVPFPDGDQHYPIRAVAADGEQERSIRLEFNRRTPEANVNSKDEALVEWF